MNKAIRAVNVGSNLNSINCIVHFLALVLLTLIAVLVTNFGAFPLGVGFLMITGLFMFLSWVINYTLLSIFVTNALTENTQLRNYAII